MRGEEGGQRRLCARAGCGTPMLAGGLRDGGVGGVMREGGGGG